MQCQKGHRFGREEGYRCESSGARAGDQLLPIQAGQGSGTGMREHKQR